MEKKNVIRTVLILVVIAAVLVGAYFAYQALSKKYQGDEKLNSDVKLNSSEQDSSGPEETDSTDSDSHSEESKAIDFTMENRDGEKVKLSDYYGKPIVLNFWASWCSPCKNEFPEFQSIYDEQGEEIQFMMVNITDGASETLETATDFLDENGYTLPAFFDTEMEGAQSYQVASIPTTFFIDKDGYVIAYYTGSLTADLLQQGISMIQ